MNKQILAKIGLKFNFSQLVISKWKKGFMYMTAVMDVYSRKKIFLGLFNSQNATWWKNKT